MDNQVYIDLKEAISVRQAMKQYQDATYINLIQQINTKTASVIKDDLGTQFVQNCVRDLSGEVVRHYFNTSDYYITVDQLALRILKFKYDDEYDPLAENNGVGGTYQAVYINRQINQGIMDTILEDIHFNQKELFPEKRSSKDIKAQKDYRESQKDENDNLTDELTGKKETFREFERNGKKVQATNLQSDHVQSRAAATYNSKYITEKGKRELQDFYNSADNMQLIHASANASKGDVRYEVAGENGKKIDLTYKATPEQLANEIMKRWKKDSESGEKRQKLIDEGYLAVDENGEVYVPKMVQKKLEQKIRHSQNEESKVILKNTEYGKVCCLFWIRKIKQTFPLE